jgi:hypothetical protein
VSLYSVVFEVLVVQKKEEVEDQMVYWEHEMVYWENEMVYWEDGLKLELFCRVYQELIDDYLFE